MRLPRLVVAIAFALAAAGLRLRAQTQETLERSAERPNIVLFLADDWSWPHASAYGDPVVKTEVFDRVARQGVRFGHAYCASPSCTPSRGGILSGQAIHRLREGANLHSTLPADIPVYPDLLEKAGYVIGHCGKAWGPGRTQPGGRERNPAGPRFSDLDAFLAKLPADRPFCFWWGSSDPHRPYAAGSGVAAGLDRDAVALPPFLPDTPEVRSDVLDYYVEVMRFDRQVGEALALLEKAGKLANTLVVVTSDNGMPFPRGKATVYDGGTRMPMAMMWPARLKAGQTTDAFVSHTDLAPTFLAAAGVEVPAAMTGRCLLPLVLRGDATGRERVFLERERHAHVREGNLSYPVRAVRTADFLYVRNLRPDRWPSGDPVHVFSVGPFGDVDPSPTRTLLLAQRDTKELAPYFARAFGKRPAEELYDLRRDPGQWTNVADNAAYAEVRAELAATLAEWMASTADPRVDPEADPFDGYPYYGGPSGGGR